MKIAILLIFLPIFTWAGNLSEVRSQYLEHPLGVEMGMEIYEYSLDLSQDNDEEVSNNINYQPNSTVFMKLGFEYLDYNLGVSLPLPDDEEDVREKGKTRHFDIVISKMLENQGFDLYYNEATGFYASIDSDNEDGETILAKRPDLSIQHIGFNYSRVIHTKTGYRLNEKYQDSDDEGHKHGWLGLAGLNKTKISSDRPLVDAVYNGSMGADDLVTGGEFWSYSVAAGYGWHFLKGNNKFGMKGYGGVGYQDQELTFIDKKKGRDALTTKINMDINYSYLYSNWKYGFDVHLDTVTMDLDQLSINGSLMAFKGFAKTQF